ncbi:MAG: apolipoprotein N-acyltransferase [Acidobacteria bacterium]|nr:apolipoprotein N-acyltransferase [Acidobacteriota bacterium]
MVLSLPGFDLWWLAWVAPAPLLSVLADRGGPGRLKAALLGVVTGTIYYAWGCYWIVNPLIQFGGFPVWLGLLFLVVAAALLALFFALVCFFTRDLVLRGGSRLVLLAPVFYLPSEWLRLTLTSIGWNSLGYTQAFQPWAIQFARWTGHSGVGFLVMAVASATAVLVVGRCRTHLRWAAAVGITVVAVLAGANLPAASGIADRDRAPTASAAFLAVQPEIPIDMNADPDSNARALAGLITLTSEALRRARPAEDVGADLTVIWPESPLYIPLDERDSLRASISEYCRSKRVNVILNTARELPDGRTFNSAVFIDRNGELTAEYRKMYLLIFGEYMPFRSVLPWIEDVPGIAADFSRGEEYETLEIAPGFRVGPNICSEAAIPEVSRTAVREGASVLINLSNDGWFSSRMMARQHLAHSVMRAVENHKALLQITNGGISARVSPRGEVLEEWAYGSQRAGIWEVPLAAGAGSSSRTLYTRWGDWFAVLCSLTGLAGFVALFIKHR